MQLSQQPLCAIRSGNFHAERKQYSRAHHVTTVMERLVARAARVVLVACMHVHSCNMHMYCDVHCCCFDRSACMRIEIR